jgi:hypothetical protein
MSRALQRMLDRGEAHRHAIERRNEAHDRARIDASELPRYYDADGRYRKEAEGFDVQE